MYLNNNIVLNKKSSNKIVIDYCDTTEKITTSSNLEFKLLNIRDAAAILIASHQSKLNIEFSNLLQLFRGYETLENVLGEKVELYSYEKHDIIEFIRTKISREFNLEDELDGISIHIVGSLAIKIRLGRSLENYFNGESDIDCIVVVLEME